ncbi:VHS-domain-containing protein [Epithele typhae]|uniref:VHS-domain-containing protein n=1 Tax=Epithele typhae TaxID=378194 RepID=UPI0020073E2B|nr:VHS-domain-containing protein [Epithele typhae]KAH9918762.1 VHS-domain-containing protein [Epithele typhae]
MFAPQASPWLQNVSQLEVLITRACNPTMGEPNYAAHLEVADYINQKKANTHVSVSTLVPEPKANHTSPALSFSPREAATTIARLVNHRNPHIAMLALALLDTLVQSCGYPFHLQIATKEFLNELVRRFPERPPPFPGPVMQKILDLIHGWKEGICVDSRWKDDFGNVRDMHRLLTFKGYRFRDQTRQASAAATVASNIKSADELEAEDREAQSAKLQELIRRGTPRDLAAAQELMKSLAGANPDAKPDYRTQALNELNKLESKVILLNEILDNVDTTNGEKFAKGDVYDQVASILRDARPKIQKWISSAETDDPESLDTYLQINDQINTVLNRYEAYKQGDFSAAANPIPPELSNGAGSSQGVSLIDFDDAPAPTASASGGGGLNDLAGLFGSSAPAPAQAVPAQGMMGGMGMGMGGMMGMGMRPQQPQAMGAQMNMGLGMGMGMGGMGMGMMGSSSHPSTPQAPTLMNGSGSAPVTPNRTGMASPPMGMGSIRLGTPQLQPGTPQAHTPQTGMGMGANMGMGMGMGMSMQHQFQQQQQQQPSQGFAMQGFQQPMQPQQQQQPQTQAPANGQQAQGKDPFADLVGLF